MGAGGSKRLANLDANLKGDKMANFGGLNTRLILCSNPVKYVNAI
jgi:hypothetical protein